MSAEHLIRYSYDDVPTVGRFSASNAFLRGLMGPYGCLPGDSEFLSDSGWKRMDAFEHGDRVAQWSVTGEIEFVDPITYIDRPCTSFIEFDSGSLVMRLSDEHRVPHWDWAGRFTVKTAGEIARKPSRRMIPTTFKGPFGSRLDMSDDLIRFAVMMHADGYYPKQGRRAKVALRRERKKERLRALLVRLGVNYEERVYAARPTESVFSFVPPYVGKRFTGAWWRASAPQLEVIFDEMRHWDGHESEYLLYSSSHKEDADFIQYVAHACGRRASISKVEYDNPAWKPNYRVNIAQAGSAKNRAAVRDRTKIRRVPATRKYCFTVPSGYFVARCDGTVFITGNSGKSSGCVIELVRRAQEQEPGPDGIRRSRAAVIRNTYNELRSTTIKTVLDWLPTRHFGHYVENKHTYLVKGFKDIELEIIFLALDKPDDLKKLLSLELTFGWVNEAREVPWAIIEALQGRVNRYPSMREGGPTWTGVWMDTNPPDTESEWYKYFEEKIWLKDFNEMKRRGDIPPSLRSDDYVDIFKQPSGLAPSAENLTNLKDGRLYYVRLAIGKTPEWKKVYVDGEYGFVIDGKPVYEHDYKDSVHCRGDVEPVPGRPIYRGWDFGLTPACVLSQVLPDGRWLVFDEFIGKSIGVDAFSDYVLRECGRNFTAPGVRFIDHGDPAGMQRAQTDERTCFEILWAKNIKIEGGEQSPEIRLGSVRRPMNRLVGGEPQFILHERCKTLRKGFMGGYQYRRLKVSGERYTDAPDKNRFSHPHDALQYTATHLFAGELTMPAHDDDFPQQEDFEMRIGASPYCGY